VNEWVIGLKVVQVQLIPLPVTARVKEQEEYAGTKKRPSDPDDTVKVTRRDPRPDVDRHGRTANVQEPSSDRAPRVGKVRLDRHALTLHKEGRFTWAGVKYVFDRDRIGHFELGARGTDKIGADDIEPERGTLHPRDTFVANCRKVVVECAQD